MVEIISLWSSVRKDYFRSQQLRNYRRNNSLSSEICGSIDYTVPVSLMVTGIDDFDTHGHLILDLDVVLKTATSKSSYGRNNVYKETI